MNKSMAGQRGISLIEALVALVVMAVGTLAVLGAQTTLRQNGDVSRQRSEAVRIAQETIEQARAYTSVANWRDGVITAGPTTVAGLAASNTTFTVQTDVVASTDENASPQKSLSVLVNWVDRTGQTQSVRLQTALQGTPPALSGTLALPRNTGPVRSPKARHFAIPSDAITQSDGSSRFSPPGLSGVQWVFDNVTGNITKICAAADPATPSCTPVTARLLSGYIRFATAVDVPTPADAEVPPGNAVAAGLRVMSGLGVTATELATCAVRDSLGARAYFCAVPASATDGWTGTAQVFGIGTLAASIADADPAKFRVCRYTPYRNGHPVVPSGMRNEEGPLVYVGVKTALTNQNFLVIKAGHGGLRNDCPDNNGSPLFNSNTWHHQPSA